MSFINPKTKEVNCKIIYYGPPQSGKSTSLRHIYKKMASVKEAKLTTLSDKDGALFFDFLPLSLGTLNDYKIRIHLYSVPGQHIYEGSQHLILKGVDGVVFVADSQLGRLDQNVESWKNLENSLYQHDVDFRRIPIVLQWNKRDLKNTLPTNEMSHLFNDRHLAEFGTIATKGDNIVEAFQTVARDVIKELRDI